MGSGRMSKFWKTEIFTINSEPDFRTNFHQVQGIQGPSRDDLWFEAINALKEPISDFWIQ